jgi:hypothetical protein
VRGLEKEFGDRIKFVRVNILDPSNKPMIEKFGFSATPEFYLVDGDGQVVGFWDVAVETDLRQAFEDILKEN